jgi:PAS domain S-box-containing protein
MVEEAIRAGREERYEHQLLRKDGSSFYAEAQAKMVRVGDQNLRVTALRDITWRKQAEEALRQSQERYVLAERAVNDGLWDWNLLTDEDYFSPRWKEILGYREDELPHHKSAFLNSVHPDDRAAVDAVTWKHLEQGGRYALEFRLRHKDGSYRWVFSRGAAQRDAAGRAYRVVGAITDITERKAAERALRESEQQYFHLFEQMLGGFILVEVLCNERGQPVDHRLLRANSGFEQMTGLKRDEEIGRTSAQLSFKWPAAVAQRYYQVALGGAPLQCERFNESLQRHYDVRVFSPRPGQLAIVFYDITARKRAEEDGRENEQRFQQLANTITDVFWIASPDFRQVYYVSPGYERIWGRTAESLYAHPGQWIAAIPPEERDRVLAYFANLSDRKSELGVEYRIVRPDGAVRWVLDRGFLVHDDAGKWIRLTGVASDITERKKLEEKVGAERERLEGEVLRRIEQEQERIGRDLHDGLCQILVGTKYRVGALEKMIANQNHASATAMAMAVEAMINDTIQQARNLAKGLNPVQLAANGLALALEALAKDIEGAGIARCSFRLGAARNITDRNVGNHLYRITQEAVQNAIKHGKARKISIVLRKLAGRIILRVGDDGVGFSVQPEISDGAGLHNMRTRTVMIGGTLAIRPGRRGGSVITVSLPG